MFEVEFITKYFVLFEKPVVVVMAVKDISLPLSKPCADAVDTKSPVSVKVTARPTDIKIPDTSMPANNDEVSAIVTMREPLIPLTLHETVAAPGLPVIVIVFDNRPEGRSSNNKLRASSCNEQYSTETDDDANKELGFVSLMDDILFRAATVPLQPNLLNKESITIFSLYDSLSVRMELKSHGLTKLPNLLKLAILDRLIQLVNICEKSVQLAGFESGKISLVKELQN